MRLSIDAYERMAGNILKIYEQAELEMTRRVANRVKRGVTQPGWTEQKYSEMKAVTRQMSKVVDSLHRDFNVQAMQYVETGYEDGRSSFINEAREFADLSQIHELTPTAIKVANIMGDLDMSMSAADRLILRQANDAYANIIGETSALIATGSYTEKQAVQIALNRFADKGISSFVDKAGRHWEMTTYAEMATLTAIERATRQGYTDTMQEFGFDLAIISSHYGACPLCEAWENVVISISGKDTHYLSLADAEAGGCFHPRCMHVFSTYYDGITRGGRDRPSPVGPANPGYAARSQQRAWERQERKWKRRMAAATTPEEERAAYARVRMYQDKIRGLVADYNNTVDPSVDYLPRKYDREGGRVKLSAEAARLKPVIIRQRETREAEPIVSKIEYGPLFSQNAVKITSTTLDKLQKTYPTAKGFRFDYVGDIRVRRGYDVEEDVFTLHEEHKEISVAGAQYLAIRQGDNLIRAIEVHNEDFSDTSLAVEFKQRYELRQKYGLINAATKDAFFTVSSSLEGNIAHEYAHALLDSFNAFTSPDVDGKEFRDFLFAFWQEHRSELATISQYAASHPDEMFAEAIVQSLDVEHTDTLAYRLSSEIVEKFKNFAYRKR